MPFCHPTSSIGDAFSDEDSYLFCVTPSGAYAIQRQICGMFARITFENHHWIMASDRRFWLVEVNILAFQATYERPTATE